jgi:hypothetical protein
MAGHGPGAGIVARAVLFAALAWASGAPVPAAIAAGSIPLRVDVPPELATYSGMQPITLGVPFARGVLEPGDGLRVVGGDGAAQLAQFQVTSSWDSGEIRWLLVDVIARISNGIGQPLFLEYGPGVPGGPTATPLHVSQAGTEVEVSTGRLTAALGLDHNTLGSFLLEAVAPPDPSVTYAAAAEAIEVELAGPIRAVVKVSGHYRTASGDSVAVFVARYRFYAGLSFARVYHTLVWTADAAPRIGALRFTTSAFASAESRGAAPFPGSGTAFPLELRTGIDGATIAASGAYDLDQADWNAVQSGAGQLLGRQWDGWAELRIPTRSLFAALRWPWQQHPTGFAADAGFLSLELIDPALPMSLRANDVVIPPLHDYDTGYTDLVNDTGPYVPLSPRGVGKTHELLLWFALRGTRDFALAPSMKNALLQRPVAGHADPAFVARAGLPSPMSPYDPAAFPEIEGAIERAFDWYTRERAEEWDYGVWNFGDLQYDWNPSVGSPALVDGHYRPDRYWLNNGRGWSLTPWLLWMRSGDRRYLERGEAHSRHVMDVDTCHVTNVPELKFTGGTYGYSLLHFGEQSWPADISNDSEYLPYYYFLTGYERARDVMQERVQALLASHPDNLYVADT